MICTSCQQKTSVTDSRRLDGVTYRRRACECGIVTFTKEDLVDNWPYHSRRKRIYKKRTKPTEAVPFSLSVEKWGLNVTKDSPEWLKNLALKL